MNRPPPKTALPLVLKSEKMAKGDLLSWNKVPTILQYKIERRMNRSGEPWEKLLTTTQTTYFPRQSGASFSYKVKGCQTLTSVCTNFSNVVTIMPAPACVPKPWKPCSK